MGMITIFFAFSLTFFLIRFAPGDPIKVLAGTDNPNPQLIAHLTVKYGLDQPIHLQFLEYIKSIAHFDLGYSYLSQQSVAQLLGEKIGPTLLLTVTGSLLALLIGTGLGIYSAKNVDRWIDRLLCGSSYVFDCLPSFWLGMILILLFASRWKLLPTSGMYDLRSSHTGWAYVSDVAKHMVLPVLTLVIIQAPLYLRMARSSVLQNLSADFVVLLRATGMTEEHIFYKYIFKNAILPILSVFSVSLAFMIGGVTLLEIVFAWPGMGRLVMNAISKRDYPLLTGVYLMLSVSITGVMILADLAYAWMDPRIRLR